MLIKRKLFTIYDDTDRLKQMKDSDILAEKKKNKEGFGSSMIKTAKGAGIGLGAGMAFGALSKSGGKSLARRVTSTGKVGALAGGLIAGTMALSNRSKTNKDINFYNNRLGYAQNQAMRREKKDWKNNMTNRDGYTY